MAPKRAMTDIYHPLAFEYGSKRVFQAPLMPDSEIPAILGRYSLKRHRALIDCRSNTILFIGPGGYELESSPGTEKHRVHDTPGGRWILPCTEFDRKKRGGTNTTSKVYIEGDYF